MIKTKIYNSYIIFVSAIVGFIAAIWTLGITPSILVLISATILFFINNFFERKHKSNLLAKLRKQFEEIIGNSSGIEIKAVEVLTSAALPDYSFINKHLVYNMIEFKGRVNKKGTYIAKHRIHGFSRKSKPIPNLKIFTGSGSWHIRKLNATDLNSNKNLPIKQVRRKS